MDAKVFECIQRKAIEVVKRMEGMSCKDQVKTLACLIWRAGRSRGISLLLQLPEEEKEREALMSSL